MYQKFFGFQRAPFELVPDPDFLFLGESHEAALANLVMGLESGKGFVAITGAVGAGKTTVLRALLRRLHREGRTCFLSQPEMDVPDLLRAILDGFDQPSDDAAVVDLRRRIRLFLSDGSGPGVLIVDEAHLLSEEAMEQLRLLSNLEEDDRKLLQIVISGQPELKDMLSRPRLRPLAQRIEMFYDIRALDRDETAAYIDRRLRIAGAPEGVGFSPEAIDTIHECTAGVPRLVNLLADRSLVSGYVADTGRVDADLVREAYDDLGEVTQAVMPGVPRGRRRSVRTVHPASGHPASGHPASAPSASGPSASGVAREPLRTETVAPSPRTQTQAQAQVPPLPPRTVTPLHREAAEPFRTRPASDAPRRRGAVQRWLAVAGVAAVVVLAVGSLGGQFLSQEGGSAVDAAPDATGESDTIPVFTDDNRAPAAEAFAVHVASYRDAASARKLAGELRVSLEVPTHVTATELDTGLWYRVLVGDFASREEARELMLDLGERGEFAFVRTVRLVRPDATPEVSS